MVDGVDVGDDVNFAVKCKKDNSLEGNTLKHQDFRNADMVVIQVPPVSDSSQKGTKGYNVFAIYGNKVISSFAMETTISDYANGLWKDKFMMAHSKPYILNGDC